MRGGGAQGAWGRGTVACAQASQWGLWVRPGQGFGTRGRLREGGMSSGDRGTPAASLLGQAACNMQHSQSRHNSTNWKKKRWDTIALPPFMVVKRGHYTRVTGYGITRTLEGHDRGDRTGRHWPPGGSGLASWRRDRTT